MLNEGIKMAKMVDWYNDNWNREDGGLAQRQLGMANVEALELKVIFSRNMDRTP
jgi:hypothetical protein